MSRANEGRQRRRVAEDEVFLRLGVTISTLERHAAKQEDEGLYLTGMTVKFYTGDAEDVFLILRADSENGPVVGFGGGPTFGEALRSTLERFYNKSIKWKRDEYAANKA